MLSRAEARELTRRIRAKVDDLLPLYIAAYRGEADAALGYESWVDYCRGELRGLSLPTGLRVPIAQGLRQELGLSSRAIGAALGVDNKTVLSDLAGEENSSPVKVTGRDGRRYPSCNPRRVKVEVKKSPLDFAEAAGELVAAMDDQHYGPDDLTAEQLRVFMNLRDALEELAVVWHVEEMASIEEREQECRSR